MSQPFHVDLSISRVCMIEPPNKMITKLYSIYINMIAMSSGYGTIDKLRQIAKGGQRLEGSRVADAATKIRGWFPVSAGKQGWWTEVPPVSVPALDAIPVETPVLLWLWLHSARRRLTPLLAKEELGEVLQFLPPPSIPP